MRGAATTVTLVNHDSLPTVTTQAASKPKPSRSSGSSRSGSAARSAKYQRILDAAVEVIAESGYFQARVTDIAARAGVADGTIYLYFKNKEQVLMAAIDSAFAAFLKRARTELSHTHEPRGRLRRLAICVVIVSSSGRWSSDSRTPGQRREDIGRRDDSAP